MSFSDRFIVVLLRPKNSRNTGSAARAMMNLGFKNLALVNPLGHDPAQAAVSACAAKEVVEKARIYKNLTEALADTQNVVGFSSRKGKNRINHLTLTDWIEEVKSAPDTPLTALLFGPEDTGLQNDQIPLCRTLVEIPAHPDNPSYNLAQAVLLVLYELSKVEGTIYSGGRIPDLCRWSEFSRLEKLIDSLSGLSEFKHSATSEDVMRLLKAMFKRIKPTVREMQILLGFFSRAEIKLRELNHKP